MVQYGHKLDLTDLYSLDWQERYAPPTKIATMLKYSGISFVELAIGEETKSSLITETARIFSGEGLFVSLHPYLYKELSPEIFDSSKKSGVEQLLSVVQEVSDITGVPAPCVFHGGRARSEPYFVSPEIAKGNAKKFFSWVDDVCTSKFTTVVPFCETQTPWDAADQEMIRLGDTYKSCVDLVQDTDMEVCWDFGHTYRSTYLGKHASLPDDYFLARVGHVHAHDTFETGEGLEDHFPLGDGLAPWRAYCAELARYSFSDTILLEINPSRYRDLDEFIFFTRDGVERLTVFFENELVDNDDMD